MRKVNCKTLLLQLSDQLFCPCLERPDDALAARPCLRRREGDDHGPAWREDTREITEDRERIRPEVQGVNAHNLVDALCGDRKRREVGANQIEVAGTPRGVVASSRRAEHGWRQIQADDVSGVRASRCEQETAPGPTAELKDAVDRPHVEQVDAPLRLGGVLAHHPLADPAPDEPGRVAMLQIDEALPPSVYPHLRTLLLSCRAIVTPSCDTSCHMLVRHHRGSARAEVRQHGLSLARAAQVMCRLFGAVAIALALLALLHSEPAYADAPGTRGEEPGPQGGTGQIEGSVHSSDGQGSVAAGEAWHGVQLLPPPFASIERASLPVRALPLAQPADSDADSLPWLSRPLNPGNWILDAGMGIFTALTAAVGEMLQHMVVTTLGGASTTQASGAPSWSVIPSSCADGAAQNFVFCTPPRLTYAHPGVQNVWAVLRAVATALITVLFLVRLGRMLADGARALATEAKPLVVTFVVVMLFVQSTEYTCGFLIDLFNAISTSILAGASFTFPAVSDTPFALGARIMGGFFWLLMLFLMLKSFFRIINIAVLIGVAPLAGAMLMDRATSSRFRSWLEKLVELLLEQVALVIVFTVAAAMLAPVEGAGSGDQLVQFLMGSLTMLMALFGPSAMIGIASSVGGGYLASMLQMRVIGAAQKAVTRGAVATGRATLTGGRAALSAVQAQGGDPSFSAAAKRMAERIAVRVGKDDVAARHHVAFRMPELETPKGGRVNGTIARYERAGQVRGEANARLRAGIRAGAMMAQADGLARAGQHAAADRMRGRAGLQRAFAAGDDISRMPRFGTGRRDGATGRMGVSPRGRERRAVYAHALEETKARHLVEQKALKASIAADQQLLAGGTPPEVGTDVRVVAERVRANQTRLAALTQTRDIRGNAVRVAPVTRREAAALARERWVQQAVLRPARPPLTRYRTPEQAEAGVRLTPRRVQSPITRHTVLVQRHASIGAGRRDGSIASRAAADGSDRARVRERAAAVTAHHQRRSTDAYGRMRELQQQARAVESTDAARADEFRRQACEASDQGRRHEALRARVAAIAGNRTWERPSSGRTQEELARRRAAFLAARQEVLASAARDSLLPEMADTADERARRVELLRQATRDRVHERVGDLAEPARRAEP
jgi:hypothetical protein